MSKKVIDVLWINIWNTRQTCDYDEYYESKAKLLLELETLKSSLEIISGEDRDFCKNINLCYNVTEFINSDLKSLRWCYLFSYMKISDYLSACLKCVFHNDFEEMIDMMCDSGYGVTSISNDTNNRINTHISRLSTCIEWLLSIDKNELSKNNEYLPEIVDKYNYAQINLCAITKLFVDCLYDSGIVD